VLYVLYPFVTHLLTLLHVCDKGSEIWIPELS
jgi:hypothetical protein